MGTQQILLIVLAVIVIGVAIVVGITMFIVHGYNNNQQAIASEMQNNYCTLAIQYYRMPQSQGGAGQDTTEITVPKVAAFLGFYGPHYSLLNLSDNGEFRVMSVNGTTVTLKALGKELKDGKHPCVTSIINVRESTVRSYVSSAVSF